MPVSMGAAGDELFEFTQAGAVGHGVAVSVTMRGSLLASSMAASAKAGGPGLAVTFFDFDAAAPFCSRLPTTLKAAGLWNFVGSFFGDLVTLAFASLDVAAAQGARRV